MNSFPDLNHSAVDKRVSEIRNKCSLYETRQLWHTHYNKVIVNMNGDSSI